MKNTIYNLNSKKFFAKKEIHMEALKPGYVRVKNLFCGICGGDYSSYLGRRNKYNISLGHEFVSEVIEIGKDISNLTVDDLVISDLNFRCGKCYYCKINKSHLCDYNDIQYFSNRAFANYSDIESSYLIKANSLQKNIISATCVEPLSCVIHAVNSTLKNDSDNILIVGCGNIGMLIAFYLKVILKIKKVYVTDIINKKITNLNTFFSCIPYNNISKFDFIFEATNDVDGLQKAISSCNKGGSICSMSHLYGLNTSLIYESIIRNEINIMFPLRNGDKKNMINALDYISKYWNKEFNSMFEINSLNSINETFNNKSICQFNKQIIKTI